MTCRERIESVHNNPPVPKNADEDYTNALEQVAWYFLWALENPAIDWSGVDHTESALSGFLWPHICEEVPLSLREELTGNQVGMAVHLAYQAWKGN